ncbi:MAG: Holliday junction branch migration protein RuvA [Clostridia bacterium]|nr:Holliday junction branch migration protein RuvA [Clostridia bacterium]
MYDYIKGILVKKTENYVVVENNGIGYKIITAKKSGEDIRDKNVIFYTYLYVREDIFDIYGFNSEEERSAFEMLISVSGVGPKAALAVLSCVTVSELAAAIVTNNTKVITAAQGVGPKMAQRIILELKDKIKSNDIAAYSYDAGSSTEDSDAVGALTVLGYSHTEALNALKGVPEEYTVEDKIKYALKNLMK